MSCNAITIAIQNTSTESLIHGVDPRIQRKRLASVGELLCAPDCAESDNEQDVSTDHADSDGEEDEINML